MNPMLILGILDLAILAMKQIPTAVAAYNQLRSDLAKMAKEGRDPTPDEMDKWSKQIAAARKILRS